MHLPANWLLFDQPTRSLNAEDESEMGQVLRYHSLLARQLASDKRKSKHRAVQRRFMERKKEQSNCIKELVKRLEKEYKLLQATGDKKQLQSENAVLEEELGARGETPCPTQEQIESMLRGQQHLIREHDDPLTAEAWDDMLRKNLSEFETSSHETDYESTGAVVLGWSDRRKIDLEKGTTRFVMSKRFPHLSAKDFCRSTFDKLCHPETHPKLFHPAVTIRMQHLQEIGKDGVVLHRCMFNPQTGGVVHTIETMMRVRHGRNSSSF